MPRLPEELAQSLNDEMFTQSSGTPDNQRNTVSDFLSGSPFTDNVQREGSSDVDQNAKIDGRDNDIPSLYSGGGDETQDERFQRLSDEFENKPGLLNRIDEIVQETPAFEQQPDTQTDELSLIICFNGIPYNCLFTGATLGSEIT